MFLTPEDLAELTGYARPSKQIHWLRLRAWVFEVDRDGRPKVLREYARTRMGAATPAQHDDEPDFSAIR